MSQSSQRRYIDQRGYNLSDKPKGVEHYDMRMLVAVTSTMKWWLTMRAR